MANDLWKGLVYPPGHRRNRVVTIAIGALYTVLGIAYFNPDELVRHPDPAARGGKQSVLQYVEHLTRLPVWGILFLLTGITLLVAVARWWRFIPPAHLACACVMMGYTAASLTTALINEGTYVVTTIFAFFVAILNLMMMMSYTSSRKQNENAWGECQKDKLGEVGK